jgi:hypothetical protein
VFNVANGDWNTGSNWTGGGNVPGSVSSDDAFIRGNRTANINGPTPVNNLPTTGLNTVTIGEAPAGLGIGFVNIGPGGTLTPAADLHVMRRGTLANAQGTLTMTGGSIAVGGIFYVGSGATGNSANGTGILNVSGTSSITGSMNIGSTLADDGIGTFNATGSNVSVGDGGVAETFIVNDFGTINFNLGAIIGSPWNYAASAVTFNPGSALVVDGTNYTGPDGVFTLINGGSLVGTEATVDESVTGFAPGYTASISFNTASGDVLLTVVPEPTSAVVLATAGVVVASARRRRR